MAFHARRDVLDQIRAAGQTFWRARNRSRRERPRPRAHERAPPDGDGGSGAGSCASGAERPRDAVRVLFHDVNGIESLARAFLNLPYRDANFLLPGPGPIWCRSWRGPRADPAIPVPRELEAFIERG